MPGTQIIVQGVLPRGADFGANKFLYPNNFTSAVAYLNAEYQVLGKISRRVWAGPLQLMEQLLLCSA